MFRQIPGLAAMTTLAALGLIMSGCVLKDPKSSTEFVPDAALSPDAMVMIGSDGDTTLLNAPPSLCANPRFGRSAGRRSSGAVTIPCWDGS